MTIRRGLKAIEGGGEGDPRLGPLCARAVHLLGGWCHSNAPFIVSCICFMTVTDDTNVRDLSSSAHVFCLHICRQIFFLSFPLSFSTSFFLSFLLACLLSCYLSSFLCLAYSPATTELHIPSSWLLAILFSN